MTIQNIYSKRGAKLHERYTKDFIKGIEIYCIVYVKYHFKRIQK